MRQFTFFTKKWFWVSVLLYILLVIIIFIVELAFGSVIAVKSLTSGVWHQSVLVFGLLYIAVNIVTYLKKESSIKNVSRLLFVMSLFLAWKFHGFLSGVYFTLVIFFLARIIKFLLRFILRPQ